VCGAVTTTGITTTIIRASTTGATTITITIIGAITTTRWRMETGPA
jgi:hypothetical protein